ncbi:MAG: NADPH:quinone oxidoreductase family protein [Pigmentiphaga sp.]
MLALLSRNPGGPETLVLENVPDPECPAGHVVLEVEACGVNYPDALFIRDQYQVKPPRPFSPGGEVCGVVVSVGQGVQTLKLGDRVIGRCGWGGMAQKLALTADRCFRIPSALPAEQAATLLFAYGTALHALTDRAHLSAGETVLVLGAAGGVGSASVELATALGARVVATASSREKTDFALALGAQETFVYPRLELSDHEGMKTLANDFKKLLGERGADVVVDPVGGAYSEPALRSIAPDGRHLILGFTAGIARMPMNLPLLKSCQIVGVDWRQFGIRRPKALKEQTDTLVRMCLDGTIRPRIAERYPLSRAAEAIARLEDRSILGKLVVTME